MKNTRLALLLVTLALLTIVSVSVQSGFATASIQDQLQSVQLKLIGEKIKLLQEKILAVGKPKPKVAETMSREELQKSLETQVAALQEVVASLKPKAIEEETARIDRRISEINKESETATGERLLELQQEMEGLLADYGRLQGEVKAALDRSLQYRQALLLQEQARALKIQVEKAQAAPKAQAAAPAKTVDVSAIRAELEKAKLKLLQTQAAAIQEKINTLKK